MAVSAKQKELIEETVCVARDEKVGVYGFVFFRGTYVLLYRGLNQLMWDTRRSMDPRSNRRQTLLESWRCGRP